MTAEFQYLESPQVSKLFDLVLQLAADLHTTTHRLRVLEAVLARQAVVDPASIEGFVPTETEAALLTSRRDAFQSRLLRIIVEDGPAEHPLREQWEAAVAVKAES